MKKNICAVAVFLFLFCLVSGLCAFDFSADVIMKNKQVGAQKGKMFVSEEKMRMDAAGMTVITRMDKKVAWILITPQKMYMEQQVDTKMVVTDKYPDEIERKLLGEETVDGRKADKYLITVKKNGGTEKIHQWICKSTGIPLKTAAVDDSWSMEFKNLKEGGQNASLFEIPSGFSKMSMQMPQIPR
ncbi:MAG: DUF4412 domain-containing protein [Candidatus Omnitrophica bacterium]|nr:DUF4412 domain-containing protein [Candidatus Omnitrophota bacterium]